MKKRPSVILFLLVSACLVNCLLVRTVFSSTISNVPSDHRIHSYVEELARRGILRGFFFSSRPYTREHVMEAIRALEQDPGLKERKLSPYEAWLLQRLKEEFAVPIDRSSKSSFAELGAELEGTATSSKTEITWEGAEPAEGSGDDVTESEQNVRGLFSAWVEVSMPYGLSLSHRFRVDTDVNNDPALLGRPWREDVGGYVANGYGKLRLGPFEALLGRDHLFWGPGASGSLILSDDAPPLDMVCVSFEWGRVSAKGFFASLDDLTLETAVPFAGDSLYPGEVVSRHLSGHRIDVRITPSIEVGFSETVIYGGPGRGLEGGYINPLNFFYAEQWNLSRNDNPIWSFDASWRPMDKLQIYGQLVVDDYQFEQKAKADEEPPEIGFLVGFYSGDPFGLLNTSVTAEYVRVNPWTYNQPLPWNRYTYGNSLLGHPLGPDADGLYVAVRRWFSEKFTAEVDYSFVRHGETSVETDWPVPIVGPWGDASFPDGCFPLGTVSKSHRIGVTARLHPTLHLDVDGFAALESASDYGNVGGTDMFGYEVGLRLSLRPEWAWGS